MDFLSKCRAAQHDCLPSLSIRQVIENDVKVSLAKMVERASHRILEWGELMKSIHVGIEGNGITGVSGCVPEDVEMAIKILVGLDDGKCLAGTYFANSNPKARIERAMQCLEQAKAKVN